MSDAAVGAQTRLDAALGRVDDLIGRLDAREEPDPRGELWLATLAGDPDAPPSWRELAAQVAAGEVTWAEVWRHPEAHRPAGPDLLVAVLRRLAADLGRA